MARLAQDSGSGAMWWPPGVQSVEDIPYDLFDAFSFASTVVGWQKNLPEDEMPPRWMWPFNDELDIWFKGVKEARQNKYGGGGGRDTTAPMMDNEFARW